MTTFQKKKSPIWAGPVYMKISLEKGCFFLWLGTNVKTAFTIFDKKGKQRGALMLEVTSTHSHSQS